MDKRLLRRQGMWIGLGLVAVGLRFLLGIKPQVMENVYSRGIYVAFRWAWDYTLGLIPFPIIYILVAGLIILGLRWFLQRRSAKKKKEYRPWGRRLLNWGMNIGAVLGGVVFFFFVFWGFNYGRVPIEEHLDLKLRPLSAEEIDAEARRAIKELGEARAQIPGAGGDALGSKLFPSDTEYILRRSLTGLLREMGYPTPGRVRSRRLWPGELMMRFGSAGIYFPFTGESYVAGNLTPVEIPFIMAHEMSHGYGFTDEGMANMLAYLACERSGHPAIRYSGRIAYWRYVSKEYVSVDQEGFAELWKTLPAGIKADLKAISENWKRYRGVIRRLSSRTYDAYLKSQGVKEGVMSYNRMVILVAAWREKFGPDK